MDLVKLLGELLLVLDPDHLEEVEMPVQGLVLVLLQLLDDGLDPEHEELEPEVESELEVLRPGAVVQHRVHEGHDGRLQIQRQG